MDEKLFEQKIPVVRLPSVLSVSEIFSPELGDQRRPDTSYKRAKAKVNAILRKYSPKANYFCFHFSYFLLFMLIGGLIVWIIERGNLNISFIDALFQSVSAMSQTGLTSVDFSEFRVYSQMLITLCK